jgi:hypothetical protein
MRTQVRFAHPHRRPLPVRRFRPPSVVARRVARPPRVDLDRLTNFVSRASLYPGGDQSDPYLDYRRSLTPEGGIAIVYKDLDLRWRYLFWRILAWSVATGFEGWFLFYRSPVESILINLLCMLIVAGLNFLIVWKPPEVYRSVEIRPDCMIVEDKDIFWLSRMENGFPTFQADKDGNQVLSGDYGTRRVEYLTARRFDEQDRMPEVLAAHLQDAMQQLWAPPERLGAWQG